MTAGEWTLHEDGVDDILVSVWETLLHAGTQFIESVNLPRVLLHQLSTFWSPLPNDGPPLGTTFCAIRQPEQVAELLVDFITFRNLIAFGFL